MREGSYSHSLLDPRKRAERALVAVVQEAYVQGVSTRRVEELVQALGLQGISKSQVSRLGGELGAEVDRFRTRRLEEPYPYVWLDATFVKVRQHGRVVSMAVVLAIGGRHRGAQHRRAGGAGAGRRAERGRRLLAPVPAGAGGAGALGGAPGDQRCARGLESRHRRRPAGSELATVPHPLHAQCPCAGAQVSAGTGRVHDPHRLCAAGAGVDVRDVAAGGGGFRNRYPKLAQLLDAAEDDVLAYRAFPREHWRQIWSNTPLERLNAE